MYGGLSMCRLVNRRDKEMRWQNLLNDKHLKDQETKIAG